MRWSSPVGDLVLDANDEGLTTVLLSPALTTVILSPALTTVILSPAEGEGSLNAHVEEAVRQLEEYFAGKRQTFDLKLAPHGTPFQQDVWRALQHIPYGATRSYAEIATAIARPSATRAVGAANGANPIPIIIPCHRVIGSNGKLTGFGGGLPMKRWLLDLECGIRPLTSGWV